MLTLKQIKRGIHKMDKALREDDDSFKVATILLAGLQVSPKDKEVSEFTGLPLNFVRAVGKRLRANGVWNGGKTYADWFDDKNGGIAFWMDVCVGQGLIERVD